MDNIFNLLKDNLTYVTYELTYKCNFNCIYCFQEDMKSSYNLITSDSKRVIDILKDNGCIFIKFTGGEPFVRSDFMDIYEYTYDKNIKLTIGTNAVLITDDQINILKEKKPLAMYISLYGATDETHDSFTNTTNQLNIVKNNILKLAAANIKIQLKSVLNKYNEKEILKIKDFADKNGINYHLYTSVIKHPELQVDTNKINKIINSINQEYKENSNFCGAGQTSAYINPMGNIYLCPRSRSGNISIFEDNFKLKLQKLREKEILQEVPCINCKYSKYGSICYPVYKEDYNRSIDQLKKRCSKCESKYGKLV